MRDVLLVNYRYQVQKIHRFRLQTKVVQKVNRSKTAELHRCIYLNIIINPYLSRQHMGGTARRPVLVCRLCGKIIDPIDDELAYAGLQERPLNQTMEELNEECPQKAVLGVTKPYHMGHQWVGRVM